ncbi:MAG: hypothetical protein QME07_05945 [bacterium]|nr:hypothetical protein [bacterium]
MKKILGSAMILGMLVIPALAEETGKGTETQTRVGTQNPTEIEALGPTRAVSSIMQGLGRKGTETHKVLFIEVLEENYDTFLPGLMVKRKWIFPYFKFDKEKRKVIVDSRHFHSPNMLTTKGEMRRNISLIVKHTIDYKGIGRQYPKYYIYEPSKVPTTINLKEPSGFEQWDPGDMKQVRYVDNLKIVNLSSEGEMELIYGKEKITLKYEELWKADKITKVIPVEGVVNLVGSEKWCESRKKFIKDNFKWFLSDKDRLYKFGIPEKDIEMLMDRKVTFSTEVTIFNHGIVEIETYRRGSK